jgi:hypothetical protein
VWAVAVIAPLVWTVLAAFKSNTEIFIESPFALPDSFSFDAFGRAWSRAHVGRYFLNSVWVVACSTAGTMLLGSMAAYVLARFQFFGNRFIYYMFVSGLAFPVFLALVPLFLVVNNLGLLNTFTGLILVYIAYSLPFTVFFLAAFFKTLPHSVAEAAMIDGASHTRTFFSVMVPMARPGHWADGPTGPGQHHDLQHHRAVEPVHPAGDADAGRRGRPEVRADPGHRAHLHGGRVRGRLGGAVRRADPVDPADDPGVRVLPAADPAGPDRRCGEIGLAPAVGQNV